MGVIEPADKEQFQGATVLLDAHGHHAGEGCGKHREHELQGCQNPHQRAAEAGRVTDGRDRLGAGDHQPARGHDAQQGTGVHATGGVKRPRAGRDQHFPLADRAKKHVVPSPYGRPMEIPAIQG